MSSFNSRVFANKRNHKGLSNLDSNKEDTMEITNSVKENVAKFLTLINVGEVAPDDIGMELFMDAVSKYKDRYGWVPKEWTAFIRQSLSFMRFYECLILNGYTPDELEGLCLKELRDLVSKGEYIETRNGTVSGGVSVKRIELKVA